MDEYDAVRAMPELENTTREKRAKVGRPLLSVLFVVFFYSYYLAGWLDDWLAGWLFAWMLIRAERWNGTSSTHPCGLMLMN